MSAFQQGFQNALGPYEMAKQGIDEGTARRKQAGLGALMADYASGGAPDYQGIAANGGNPLAVRQDADGQKERALQEIGQMAGYLAALPDGNTRAQAFQSMRTKLDPLGQSLGLPPLPPQWDESHLPELQALAQQFGGAKGVQPESFSNGGQGFLIGNRGTTKPIEGYADQAGQIAHAQAQARGQAQQQYRASQRVAATGGGGSGGVSRRAPSGYEWTPDGSLRAIRGGPADKPHAAAPGKGPNGAPLPKSSGDERAAMGYLGRMSAAEGEIQKLYRDGYDPGNLRDFFTAGEGVLLNPLASDKGQLHRQQQEDFVRAKLRKESGAAIPVEEMDREIKTYFPQPGDSDMVVQGKTRSRQQALKQMETMAGRAYVSPNRPTAADADAKIGPLDGGLSADEQAELDELRKRFGKK